MDKEVEEFIANWKGRCEDIKKRAFTKEQCSGIIDDYIHEMINFYAYNRDKKGLTSVSNKVLTDLNLALQIAISNYRRENKGFWSKLFKHIKIIIFGK